MAKPTAWTTLWGVNRARFLTATVVLAVGAQLRYVETITFPFPPFALVVAGMGLACLVLPLVHSRVRDPRCFAWFQLCLDVVLVTAVVATTGGPQSIFVPLYVLTAVAACFVLPRAGSLIVAGLSSLLQIGLVAGRASIVLLRFAEPWDTMPLEILAALLNASVLLFVSIAIASLADRYQQSQEHLETQRKRLSDVQAFRD